jgi:hypothetical protein
LFPGPLFATLDKPCAAYYEWPDWRPNDERRDGVMAVAMEVTFRGDGATLDNYFKSLTTLGTGPDGKHPDAACLFHRITDTDDGLRVTDVWKTKHDAEKFIADRVGPASHDAGLPTPDVKYVDVDNYLTAGS